MPNASLFIRAATASDAAAISEIHVSTWRIAYRGQMPAAVLDALDVTQRTLAWTKILGEKHSTFVAVQDGAIVGFGSLLPSRDADAFCGTVAELAALYVSSSHWRCRVGSALCSHAFIASAAAGYSSITLWVLATNHLAKQFYISRGFAPDGVTKKEPLGDGFLLDEQRMRRAISGSG